MHSILASTLTKVAMPAFAIAVALIASRMRGFDLRSDLALRWPAPKVIAAWVGLWCVWMGAEEVVLWYFHLQNAAPWPPYPTEIILLRVLAIGILGPIAEELIFRGLLFFRLEPKLRPAGTIAGLAVAWALLHYKYDVTTIVMICLDGIVLGTARYRSRSTLVPMLMHVIANLLSIAQSVWA